MLRRPHGDAPLVIDGSAREGGGQILTLSMLTGKPLVLERIRGRRSKPGLLRQHVTCVNAAAAVSYRHGAELARRSPRTAPLSRVNH
ncbi:MAG: hypothetical protein KF901_13135 [Myxococcales bacterium]|nr:hypothetical protein [Myxococcales bacterium]